MKSGKKSEEQASGGEVMQEARQKFTNEMLLQAWQEFSKIHADNRVMLSQIMDQHTPVLLDDGETYKITLFNEFQEKKIQEYAFDIVNHLKGRLKNSHIKMKLIVDESKDEQQFFTSTDKLKLMIETNPDLNLLRKTFDLDLE